jgi:hypothetical protein
MSSEKKYYIPVNNNKTRRKTPSISTFDTIRDIKYTPLSDEDRRRLILSRLDTIGVGVEGIKQLYLNRANENEINQYLECTEQVYLNSGGKKDFKQCIEAILGSDWDDSDDENNTGPDNTWKWSSGDNTSTNPQPTLRRTKTFHNLSSMGGGGRRRTRRRGKCRPRKRTQKKRKRKTRTKRRLQKRR